VQHRITARVESDASLPTVLADANQILQVIMQIIRNAIDAVSELGGGELTIRTRKDGARVLLEVSDSGSGIRAPEKVFDPFYTTKPVGKGTGLGLSTAYGIIQRHDGEIACQNNPAGGATFRITLPAESPA
jgi:two-component system NtrC family sensor kinase